jgi:hypothetical protein
MNLYEVIRLMPADQDRIKSLNAGERSAGEGELMP